MADGYRCPQCGDIMVGYVDHCDENVISLIGENPLASVEDGYPNCPSCPPPDAVMEPVNVAWTPRDVLAQHGLRQAVIGVVVTSPDGSVPRIVRGTLEHRLERSP